MMWPYDPERRSEPPSKEEDALLIAICIISLIGMIALFFLAGDLPAKGTQLPFFMF